MSGENERIVGEDAARPEQQQTEGESTEGGERKAEPISLEELRNKMQEQQQKQSRPVFKTKEQRREEALARKEQEARAKQREREQTLDMVRQNEKRRRLEDAVREKEKLNAARAAAQAEKDSKGKPGSKQAAKPQQSAVELAKKREIVPGTHLKMEELEVLKQKYLGRPVQKKQIVAPTDAKRFEWDATEDTSRDPNDLYDRPYEARLLFGRGFRAGIDTNQQVDKALDYEDVAKRHQREVTKLTQAGRIGEIGK